MSLATFNVAGVHKEEVSQVPKVSTSEDYDNYLTKCGETDPEALKVREQFRQLSPEEKGKFMYYLLSPQLLKVVFETPMEEDSRKEFYGGDIVVTNKTKTKIMGVEDESTEENGLFSKVISLFVESVYAATAKMYDMRVEHTQDLGVVGVKTTKLTAWVKYKSKDKRTVASIQAGNGSCIHWNPLVKYIKDDVSKYILGNKAHTAIVWRVVASVSIPFVQTDSMCCSWNHHVLGFANGSKTFRCFK
jgi:hypothetical protein